MSFDLAVKDYAITAGQTLTIHRPASFFQLMDASGAVDIEILRAESTIGNASGVTEGFSFGGKDEPVFQGVKITSATTQTLKICFARGSADLRQIVGNVSVSSYTNNGTATQAQAATGADAQLLAANTSRRLLMLQNIGTVDVFYTIDGGTADANGFKLSPEQGLTLDVCAPTGAIRTYSAAAGSVAYAEI